MIPQISIIQRPSARGRFSGTSYRRRVRKVLLALGLQASELSILLTDDVEIGTRRDAQKDRPTDVLSFGQQPVGGVVDASDASSVRVLGDIVLSVETLERQARTGCLDRLKEAIGARSDRWSCLDEATFLSLHGILHLIGYDHETPEDAEVMEALEANILQTVLRFT